MQPMPGLLFFLFFPRVPRVLQPPSRTPPARFSRPPARRRPPLPRPAGGTEGERRAGACFVGGHNIREARLSSRSPPTTASPAFLYVPPQRQQRPRCARICEGTAAAAHARRAMAAAKLQQRGMAIHIDTASFKHNGHLPQSPPFAHCPPLPSLSLSLSLSLTHTHTLAACTQANVSTARRRFCLERRD